MKEICLLQLIQAPDENMNTIRYRFYYDSISALLTKIDFDTLGVLTIEYDINKVDILFHVPGVFYSKYTAFINSQNQITSVYTFDSFSLAYREMYRFNYIDVNIDSMKLLLSYSPQFNVSVNEYELLFNGQNYKEMKYANTRGGYYYGDLFTDSGALNFSYTPLLNSNQIPFQHLF